MTQLQRLFISSEYLSEEQILLTPAQQHYLNRVLRLQEGDRFIAMNGQGQWWLAVLTESPFQAKILESIASQTELPVAVTLLIAMPKSGLEDVVRQITELGVTNIVLVASQRTVLKPGVQKIDRWQRIAQEAAEQSERQIVPVIHAPQGWTEALQHWTTKNSAGYLCEARGNHPHLFTLLREGRRQQVSASRQQATDDAEQPAETTPQIIEHPEGYPESANLGVGDRGSITLAIGPEGGWTDTEIDQAVAAGYQPVSLGSRILRTVTAPVAAMAIVAAVLETPTDDFGF